VKFERKLARTISLEELKNRDELADMPLVRKGNRLSVMPVAKGDWDFILTLEKP
jgi:predicted RNA-binding protein with PUA-like domain